MNYQEYIGLWEALKKKKKAGLITKNEYHELGVKLDKAYKDGKQASEIEKEIGCDPGTLATDDAIIRLGKEFRKIYGQAAQEMQAKLDDFLKTHMAELYELNQKAADGTITPDEAKRLENLTLQKAILGQKVDQLTGVMTNANQKAMAAVNGEMLGVFAENAAWQSYQITKDAKMDLMFSIYDEHTAENLIKSNPKLLPPRKGVNGQKDQAWNRKMLAGTVAQAVIQGESIPKLARRIAADLGEKNSKAMMRYARTAMTGAQNAGRIEMLHQAAGMGIKVKKRWLATLDSRTRDSHQHMDGVSIGVDEEFKTPLGSKMQYPGDPSGKGGDVWNCRCTLVYDYEGFPNDPAADVRRDNEDSQVIPNMTYDEWKAAKANGGKPSGNANRTGNIEEIKRLISEHSGDWNPADLKEVGKKLADEIQERQKTIQNIDYTAEINRLRGEFRTLGTEYFDKDLEFRYAQIRKSANVDELEKESKALKKKRDETAKKIEELEKKQEEQRSGALRSVLSEIRLLGGVTRDNMSQFMNLSRAGKTADATIDAMNFYPSDWLKSSSGFGITLKPKWNTGRAYYSPGDGEIRVDERRGTCIHELGHRFEQVVPGIRKAEQEFYAERTAGESLQWLGPGYSTRERTRKDKFINPYMGKDYGGQAFELVSMGFQYAYTDYDKLSTDPDMRDWILGLLAAL